jgi:hypothetical protein
MLTLATLAFMVGLKPSDNYWDYLLDPFIVIFCLVAPVVTLVRGRRAGSAEAQAREGA